MLKVLSKFILQIIRYLGCFNWREKQRITMTSSFQLVALRVFINVKLYCNIFCGLGPVVHKCQ